MIVCNVSLRPPRRAIAADLAEAAGALDALGTGNVVFATLVDDPASVLETVDAYLGEIMLEAASAADAVSLVSVYDVAVVEAATAADTQTGTLATTTWNPSDKSANVSLSNGDLTAQGTNGSDGGVRSTTSHASGKYYFEVTWSSATGGVDAGCGIATSAAVLASMGSTGLGVAVMYQSGTIYVNGSNTGIAIATPTLPVCIAVDLANSRIWFRVGGGNWNNSGSADPATNVGGINIAALFPSNAAYAAVTTQNSTNTYTANFGASAFSQPIPSGFTAWT
jgi:hypothetical protein